MADSEIKTSENASVKPEPVASEATDKPAETLPPLTAQEFRLYNSMSEKMNEIHNWFRSMWNELWQACLNGKRPHGKSLNRFLQDGITFTEYLNHHHSIEERLVFPRLAKKMPEFSHKNGLMVEQHKVIHTGLDGLSTYLKDCQSGKSDFDLRTLKQKMEPWKDTLWSHLDEEVKSLRAENMRKYWSKSEIRDITMF